MKVTIRNIAASLIHEYAKSIAVKNTTSPALIFSRIGATQVINIEFIDKHFLHQGKLNYIFDRIDFI